MVTRGEESNMRSDTSGSPRWGSVSMMVARGEEISVEFFNLINEPALLIDAP